MATQNSEARWLCAIAVALLGCGVSTLDPVRREVFVTTSEVDFGEVYVGTSEERALEISNGGRSAHLVEVSLSAPFTSANQLEVPGGSSADLRITFAPIEPGDFSTPLVIGAQTVTVKGLALAIPECTPPVNTCFSASFDLGERQCVETQRPDGSTCTSRCVPSGLCSLGVCAGDFASCDDGDLCTDDACSEAQGCLHMPRQCPAAPGNPCRVGACDPVLGCVFADARDGVVCGTKNCRANTIPVCIAAQCVDRPNPTAECLNQFAYLKASNSQPSMSFGNRVVVSADGKTIAVASAVESTGGAQSGAVYVFQRNGNAWTQEAFLKASNAGTGDSFGYSLAISPEGDTLAIGAQLEDGPGDTVFNSGAVYIFTRTAGAWSEERVLRASDASPVAHFGSSVALSRGATRLVVGAPEAGEVYSFDGTTWTENGRLSASNEQAGDLFGFSVALSGDGTLVAVGALGEDSSATGVNGDQTNDDAPQSGAVYLFRNSTQLAYVKASNTGAGDVFGISLALSDDGTLLAVGAYGEDSSVIGINGIQTGNSASQSGAIYLFSTSTGAWAQEAFVKASNTQSGDDFGYSLSLSRDGLALAAGAWSENSSSTGIDGHQLNQAAPDSGAVYFFRKVNGAWRQDAYVKASNTDPRDFFGHSVALDGVGSTLVSSAIGEDSSALGINGNQLDNSANESGAVYVFSLE